MKISHPDKTLYPEADFTKEDLARYYKRIKSRMLPWLKDRPLTLRAFPRGIDEDGFFNKHAPDYIADELDTVEVPMKSRKGKSARMALASSARDLVFLAGQNVIELHTFLSRAGDLEKPDQVVFDLDPSGDDFEKVRRTARHFVRLLEDRDLPVFLKLTGSRGIHLHIPLKAEAPFQKVKDAARALAEMLHEAFPDLTTLEQRKDKRGDKVFLDYLRNEYGQTCIAPYCLRALPGAPVAAPVRTDELDRSSLSPRQYTLSSIFRRLSRIEDPWKQFNRSRISPDRFIKAAS